MAQEHKPGKLVFRYHDENNKGMILSLNVKTKTCVVLWKDGIEKDISTTELALEENYFRD